MGVGVPYPIVPGCDGAGVVEAVGTSVTEFVPGDRVVTYLAPDVAASRGDDAYQAYDDAKDCLGIDGRGTFMSKGVLPETALVHAPSSVDFVPAATITGAWLTAWNAFFGLKGRELQPGSWVLVQGTGGMSVACLQIAAAVGAHVVATTSTDAKAARLKDLGAEHTVNYRTNATGWGQAAKALTPEGRGFDIVVDVGGNETLSQSLVAVRLDGMLLPVGGLGDAGARPVPLMMALVHSCIVRGILGGTRNQLRQVVKFIEEKGIVPAVDDVVFELAEAKDAWRRMKEKKHFAKIAIRIDH